MTAYHQILVSAELGGAGLIALNLARSLNSRGNQCDAWIPGEGAALIEAERLGIRRHNYEPSAALSASRYRAALGNVRLARRIRRAGNGLVHIHSPGYYGAFRWGLRLANMPRVVHVQIEEPKDLLQWAFRRPPELIITCAKFLVEQVRDALPAKCRKSQRIVSVPNSVDLERFHPGDKYLAKKELGAPIDRPMALMLANLAPHKGQETAIRATAQLKQRGKHITVWLAGTERDGSQDYTARLKNLASELGVADHVRLLGQRSDAPTLLRACDFFLLPSTREGLPLSILEAQATKVPVLAAPTAGVPEVIAEGRTGFLIPPDDPAAYAARMEELMSNDHLASRVAECAFERVARENSWKAFTEKIWDQYQEVLCEPRNALLIDKNQKLHLRTSFPALETMPRRHTQATSVSQEGR